MTKRKLYGAAKKSHEKKVRREKAHKQARKLARIRKVVVERKRRVRPAVEFAEFEVTATTKGGTPKREQQERRREPEAKKKRKRKRGRR